MVVKVLYCYSTLMIYFVTPPFLNEQMLGIVKLQCTILDCLHIVKRRINKNEQVINRYITTIY